jgi:hypothetical protein
LHRQVVVLYEHVASLIATAHRHAASGAVIPAGAGEGGLEAPSPLPEGVSPGYRNEQLYRELVSLHEHLARLSVSAHLHTASGADHPR